MYDNFVLILYHAYGEQEVKNSLIPIWCHIPFFKMIMIWFIDPVSYNRASSFLFSMEYVKKMKTVNNKNAPMKYNQLFMTYLGHWTSNLFIHLFLNYIMPASLIL